MLETWVFDFVKRDGEGNRRAYLCLMFVASEALAAQLTMGSATRHVAAARKGRERTQRGSGKGQCCHTIQTRTAPG